MFLANKICCCCCAAISSCVFISDLIADYCNDLERNDILCVERDVKLYSLTHSLHLSLHEIIRENCSRVIVLSLCWMLQRQVELSTVAEAYFQMLLKLCDNQVDVSFLSAVLGLYCFIVSVK